MKKIVAVVLALVMVLGLSTVAFADTKDYDAKDVKVVAKDGTAYTVDAGTKVTMTTENKVTENGKFASVTPAYYVAKIGGVDYTYTACDASVATHLLTVAGTQVYVNGMAAPTVVKEGASLYTAPKKAVCDKVGANEDVYVVVDGKYYALSDNTGTPVMLANGGMVFYTGTAVDATTHTLKADSLKYNVDGTVATFVCSTCEKTVSVIPAAKKPAFATNYLTISLLATNDYVYAVGTGAVAGTDGDKVESAQTFDAGIAMYVGMSVMAAAGSAVVLKKKD